MIKNIAIGFPVVIAFILFMLAITGFLGITVAAITLGITSFLVLILVAWIIGDIIRN